MADYANSLPQTKRSVLKLAAKVFDLIGLIGPFTVTIKMLFQSLCISDVNWDDDLEAEQLAKWKSIISELHALNKITVPRCYFK